MKKFTRILFLAGALSVFSVTASHAQQITIRARLADPPRVAPPPRPSPNHAWVEGEWVPNGGTYMYKAGYWSAAPRPHARWVRGHGEIHPRRMEFGSPATGDKFGTKLVALVEDVRKAALTNTTSSTVCN